MDWHRRFGLTMLGLVTFRLYWGVAGTQTARFSSFVKGPNAIAAYIRKLKRPYSPAPGHNPLGALSVLALIAALVLQVTAGLFAVDVDGLESGPLSHLVSFDQGRAAAEFHETVFNILIALIVLHVAALIFYRVRLQTNLVTAMITGRRANSEPGHDGPFPLVRFIIGVALAGDLAQLGRVLLGGHHEGLLLFVHLGLQLVLVFPELLDLLQFIFQRLDAGARRG